MAATSVSLPIPNKKGAATPRLSQFEEVPHLVGASAQAKASSLCCSTFNHVQPKSMIPARPKK
jgi:hypothetical protein